MRCDTGRARCQRAVAGRRSIARRVHQELRHILRQARTNSSRRACCAASIIRSSSGPRQRHPARCSRRWWHRAGRYPVEHRQAWTARLRGSSRPTGSRRCRLVRIVVRAVRDHVAERRLAGTIGSDKSDHGARRETPGHVANREWKHRPHIERRHPAVVRSCGGGLIHEGSMRLGRHAARAQRQPKILGNTFEHGPIRANSHNRRKDLLHRRQEPIRRKSEESQLGKPGTDPAARAHENRHPDQTEDSDTLEYVFRTLRDGMVSASEPGNRPTGIVEALTKEALIAETRISLIAPRLSLAILARFSMTWFSNNPLWNSLRRAAVDQQIDSAEPDDGGYRHECVHENARRHDQCDGDVLVMRIRLPPAVRWLRGSSRKPACSREWSCYCARETDSCDEDTHPAMPMEAVADVTSKTGHRKRARQIDRVRQQDHAAKPGPSPMTNVR